MSKIFCGSMRLFAVLGWGVLWASALWAQTAQPAPASQAAEEARSLNAEAVRLYKEGKYLEAILPAKRALEIWEKERGKDSEQAATASLNLAEIHQAARNYAEAENFYYRTLKIKEKLLGADSPELCKLLINLGWVQHVTSRAIEAESSFKRAVAIKEKQRGADHPEVADALSNLAAFYQKIGKPKNSLPLYERMIAIREKSPGENQRDLVEAMEQCHCALNQSGKHAEASAMWERLVKLSGSLPPQTIRVSGGVLQGAAIQKVQPHYPQSAKAERLSGSVYIKVIVDESGNVAEAGVICGPDLLAAASLDAARKWRFSPTTLRGVPVKVQGVLTFVFTLQ